MQLTIEINDAIIDEVVTACAYKVRIDPALFDSPLAGVTAEAAQEAFQAYLANGVPALLADHRARAAAYAAYREMTQSFTPELPPVEMVKSGLPAGDAPTEVIPIVTLEGEVLP